MDKNHLSMSSSTVRSSQQISQHLRNTQIRTRSQNIQPTIRPQVGCQLFGCQVTTCSMNFTLRLLVEVLKCCWANTSTILRAQSEVLPILTTSNLTHFSVWSKNYVAGYVVKLKKTLSQSFWRQMPTILIFFLQLSKHSFFCCQTSPRNKSIHCFAIRKPMFSILCLSFFMGVRTPKHTHLNTFKP